MRWRRAQTITLAVLTLIALGTVPWVVGATDRSPFIATARADPPAAGSTVYATVGTTPSGAPIPANFMGLSLEYSALPAYTGGKPAAVNPVFLQLLRNLAPARGQSLVLRIGGDSTDSTWWPTARVAPPPGVGYALTPAWLASARSLAASLGARLILGVNLAAGRPALAAAETRALLDGIGRQYVSALEIGNEPDVYGVFPWYDGSHGAVFARGAGYSLSDYIGELGRWITALPNIPIAGPSFAELPWMAGLPEVARAEPGVHIMTVHRYPLQGCLNNRSSPSYPSVANLLSDRSSSGLAQALVPYVEFAHHQGLQFRVDEMNSAALAGCLGRTGVSDTFSSALWALDTLFNLAAVGVDGVNVHSLPGAAYQLFTFTQTHGSWQGSVKPDYYGMLMFSQAFPPGAQLLPVAAPAGPVKVWATRSPDGRVRVVAINEESRSHQVELQLPGGNGQARLEWLQAPGALAKTGVTLGEQSFGMQTATGRLPAPSTAPIPSLLGWYSIDLPADSAVLLTR